MASHAGTGVRTECFIEPGTRLEDEVPGLPRGTPRLYSGWIAPADEPGFDPTLDEARREQLLGR